MCLRAAKRPDSRRLIFTENKWRRTNVVLKWRGVQIESLIWYLKLTIIHININMFVEHYWIVKNRDFIPLKYVLYCFVLLYTVHLLYSTTVQLLYSTTVHLLNCYSNNLFKLSALLIIFKLCEATKEKTFKANFAAKNISGLRSQKVLNGRLLSFCTSFCLSLLALKV